jgi:PiT family inorganic phosphate transporter
VLLEVTVQHLLADLNTSSIVLLCCALLLAFGFEAINGFHDTANAVATVIYTHTLKPWHAVVWSGLWNFTGVLLSSGAVAFGIVALLPVELVLHAGSAAGFAMVFALLISAVIWNFSTWYVGIPASSSHTLIGSIVGVGLMNAAVSKHPFGDGVNWGKLHDTFLALFLSPIIGFVVAGGLLLLMKAIVRNKKLYEAPVGEAPPVWWIRALLVLTCTGVSFAHGSNDGQKGMGLIMLILIGVLPGVYAINPMVTQAAVEKLVSDCRSVQPILAAKAAQGAQPSEQDAENALSDFLKSGAKVEERTYSSLAFENERIERIAATAPTMDALTDQQRKDLRTKTYLVGESIGKLTKGGKEFPDPQVAKSLTDYKRELDGITKFIPVWVKFMVALCLGIGTMIGWKRIVVTIGEKIGKSHLTYAQGASAELVTWATIQGADILGLPVSTTHILSSGVAGTMAANHSGLQMQTLRNIMLAWVLTVPVTVFLGAALFGAGLYIVLNWFGMH